MGEKAHTEQLKAQRQTGGTAVRCCWELVLLSVTFMPGWAPVPLMIYCHLEKWKVLTQVYEL